MKYFIIIHTNKRILSFFRR